MLKSVALMTTAALLAGSPAVAAGLEASQGARISSAAAGLYLAVPFGGTRSGKPQAGLRLQMTHDYRVAGAYNAPVVQANAMDLRLLGDKQTTLYVANMPVTGEEARKRNLTGASTLVTVAIVAAAVVGGVVILNAVTDDNDDRCLDPAICD